MTGSILSEGEEEDNISREASEVEESDQDTRHYNRNSSRLPSIDGTIPEARETEEETTPVAEDDGEEEKKIEHRQDTIGACDGDEDDDEEGADEFDMKFLSQYHSDT